MIEDQLAILFWVPIHSQSVQSYVPFCFRSSQPLIPSEREESLCGLHSTSVLPSLLHRVVNHVKPTANPVRDHPQNRMIHAPRQRDRHHAPKTPQPHSRRTPPTVAHDSPLLAQYLHFRVITCPSILLCPAHNTESALPRTAPTTPAESTLTKPNESVSKQTTLTSLESALTRSNDSDRKQRTSSLAESTLTQIITLTPLESALTKNRGEGGRC